MPFCTNCGAENTADAAFCEECGTPLLADAAPTPPPQAAAGGGFCPFRLCAPIAAVVLIAAAAGGVFAYRATSGDDDNGSSVVAEETASPKAENTAKPTLKPTARRTATEAPATKPPPTETPPSPPTESPPTEQPLPPGYATPEEALFDWVIHFLQQEYAGDCETTDIETDVGKICSVLYEDRGSTVVYAVGLTFSEFGMWVLVENGEGGWRIANQAEVDETFEPPF